MNRPGHPAGVEVVLTVDDLDAALAFYVDQLGFRLDMIMPADAPRVALVSAFGMCLRLQQRAATDVAQAPPITTVVPLPSAVLPAIRVPGQTRIAFGTVSIEPIHEHFLDAAIAVMETPIVKRADGSNEWSAGRAGMQYRDLIPGRVGGFVIASQIRIEQGGPVDDYVHYHKVGLQLIYCRRGWVRVVYEDQGPSFVMQPGDCVLQPPTIRHRVLESSAGLEVIELGIPAEHETRRDHDLTLPTATIDAQRDFGGQRFVRHIASDAPLKVGDAVAIRDIGIDVATNQMASARVVHLRGASATPASLPMLRRAFRFVFVLDGSVQLLSSSGNPVALATDDACVLASGDHYLLLSATNAHVLDICFRAV